jgi:hypothetical protein
MATKVKRSSGKSNGNDGKKNEEKISYLYGNKTKSFWNNGESMLSVGVRKQNTEKGYIDAVININKLDENNKFVKIEGESENGNIYDSLSFNLSFNECLVLDIGIKDILNEKSYLCHFNHVSKETNSGTTFEFFQDDEGFHAVISIVEDGEITYELSHDLNGDYKYMYIPKDQEDDELTEEYINVDLKGFIKAIKTAASMISGIPEGFINLMTGSRNYSGVGGQVNRKPRRTISKSFEDISEDDEDEEEEVKPTRKKSSTSTKKSTTSSKKKSSSGPKTIKNFSKLLDDDDDDE